MRWLLSWIVFVLIALPPTYAAAASDKDWKLCVDLSGEEGIAACTRILDDPKEKKADRTAAFYNRGTIHYRLGRYDEAIADFDRALVLDPKHANAHYNRALAHREKTNYPQAIADLDFYIARKPKEADAWATRGRTYALMGQHDKAVADLNKAVALDPKNSSAFFNLALSKREQGLDDEALAAYDTVLKLNRDEANAYYNRGLIHAAKANFKAAAADFDAYLQRHPGDPDALFERGKALAQTAEYDRALADFDAAIAQRPANGLLHYNRAIMLSVKGDAGTARIELDEAIRLDPNLADAYGERARVRYDLGDRDGALADLDEAIRLIPEYTFAYLYRCYVKYQVGRTADALKDCLRLVALDPKNASAHNNHAWIELRLGNIERALEAFEAAARLEAGDPDILSGRGSAKLATGALEAALADATAAVGINREFVYAQALQGEVLERLGRRQEAIAAYRAALAGKPRPGDRDDALATELATAAIARLESGATIGPADSIARSDTGIALAVTQQSQQVQTVVSTGATATSTEVPKAKSQQLGRRVALVIGNSDYRNAGRLINPGNDARAIAAALRQLGFAQVVERFDLSRDRLGEELKAFGDIAEGADWAVVYYAGHGMEVGGVNYLIPVDAKLQRSSHIEDEAIDLSRVLGKVAGARKLRLVILDACRSNPFARSMQLAGATRAVGSGLAAIEPPPGVLVAYAARDGQVSLDGAGSNSPFAEALLATIDEPGLEIGFLLRRVRDSVLAKTDNAQEPFTYGALPAEAFYFRTAE